MHIRIIKLQKKITFGDGYLITSLMFSIVNIWKKKGMDYRNENKLLLLLWLEWNMKKIELTNLSRQILELIWQLVRPFYEAVTSRFTQNE